MGHCRVVRYVPGMHQGDTCRPVCRWCVPGTLVQFSSLAHSAQLCETEGICN